MPVRTLVAALIVLALPASATAAVKRGTCPDGRVPVIAGKKVALKKGKLRCKAAEKLKAGRVIAPSDDPKKQLAATVDQLDEALRAQPDAFDKVQRKLGARRTKALLGLGLDQWRGRVGAAFRAADEGLHVNQRFDIGEGKAATVKLDAGGVADPSAKGVSASGEIEVDVTGKALKDMGAGELTGGKGAKVTVAVSFLDQLTSCPSAEGKVKGKLNGKAKVTLVAEGGATQSASAAVALTYELTVGGDARFKTIDNVETQVELQYGGTGKGTETWRGRRLGSGFATDGVLGSKDFNKAIEAQYTHINQSEGGIFGPHSRVRYDTGPTAWDIKSIDNLKGLIVTQVATDYLMLAALEYVRKVAAPRNEKHWYDAEACLKLDAAPDKPRLGPGETAKVTARNAKAADGTPAEASLAASGNASLVPGSASLARGSAFDFTLTAPNATPTKASWQIVALSKAGKKTLSGTLEDQVVYTVALDDMETGDFATHKVTAKLTGTLKTTPVAGDAAKWSASAPVTWTPISAESKIEYCWLEDPKASGVWTAEITASTPDTITVRIDFSADTQLTYTYVSDPPPDESGDPPRTDTPGMAGASPVAFAPREFTLPRSGGTQTIFGELKDEGDGFTSSGTVTVTPG